MKLAYQAYDKSGKVVSGTIEAMDRNQATDQLRRRGLFVASMEQSIADSMPAACSAQSSPPGHRTGRGRRLKNLAMFTRQFYILLASGTPMVEALSALERQTKDKSWRSVIADLRLRLEEGSTLSEAMAENPESFDEVYRSLIAAGESGGKFEPILDRLSQLTRRQLQIRNTVAGALIYPGLLLTVAGVVMTLMLAFVLPRFSELFETLEIEFPPTTKIMMFASDVVRSYWWVFSALVTVIFVGTWQAKKTSTGRLFIDTFMIRVPLAGPLVRSFITARIARLLGVLADSFVPLLDALALAKEAAVNIHYRRLIDEAEKAVTRGDPISIAFKDERLVSPSVYEAMRSGETTGRVSEMLINIADFIDEENESMLKTVTGMLEPIILIGLGVMVGLVALSMFMPLFDLVGQAGTG